MKRLLIAASICLSASSVSYAQGLPGSYLPKEVLGRTDRSEKEIAALNREVELRQLLLKIGLTVPIVVLAYILTKKKINKKTG